MVSLLPNDHYTVLGTFFRYKEQRLDLRTKNEVLFRLIEFRLIDK